MHPLPMSSLIVLFKIKGAPNLSIADFNGDFNIFNVCVTSEELPLQSCSYEKNFDATETD